MQKLPYLLRGSWGGHQKSTGGRSKGSNKGLRNFFDGPQYQDQDSVLQIRYRYFFTLVVA